MTVEQRYAYRVSDLTTGLFHWINVALDMSLAFIVNHHIRCCALKPSVSVMERIIHIQRKKYLHEKA